MSGPRDRDQERQADAARARQLLGRGLEQNSPARSRSPLRNLLGGFDGGAPPSTGRRSSVFAVGEDTVNNEGGREDRVPGAARERELGLLHPHAGRHVRRPVLVDERHPSELRGLSRRDDGRHSEPRGLSVPSERHPPGDLPRHRDPNPSHPSNLTPFLFDPPSATATALAETLTDFALAASVPTLGVCVTTVALGLFAVRIRSLSNLLDYNEQELIAAFSTDEAAAILAEAGPSRSFLWALWRSATRVQTLRETSLFAPPPSQAPVSSFSPSLELLVKSMCKAKDPRKHHGIVADAESEEESTDLSLGEELRRASSPAGSYAPLPIEWFTDSRRLNGLVKESDRKHSRFVASTGFEEWAPLWIGTAEDSATRKRLFAERLKSFSTTAPFARIQNNIASFWLSHAIVGLVDFSAVFLHILLLSRLADEHSTNFAVRYERRMLVLILNQLKVQNKPSSTSTIIASVDESIVDRLLREDNNRGNRTTPQAPRTPQPARERSPRRTAPAAPYARTAPAGPRTPTPKARASEPKSAPSAPRTGTPPAKSDKRHICFLHDPVSGARCPNYKQCSESRDHLDTNKPDLKVRFDRAKTSFDSRAPR